MKQDTGSIEEQNSNGATLQGTAACIEQTLPKSESLSGFSEDCVVEVLQNRSYHLAEPEFIYAPREIPRSTLKDIEAREATYTPIFAAGLKDGRLIGNSCILSKDSKFLYEFGYWHDTNAYEPTPFVLGDLVTFKTNEEIELDEAAAHLFWFYASGSHYSHWLLQTLPRLDLLDKAGARYSTILVQQFVQRYQLETLHILGFPEDKVVVRQVPQVGPAPVIRCKELFTVSQWQPCLGPTPSIERLIAHFADEPRGPEKIYVARTDAVSARRFLNEAAIIEIAKEFGYTIVVPSALSLKEEVSLFRNARVVIGPFGAGIYNASFSNPGALVVALSAPEYAIEWLSEMAHHYGHKTAFIFGESMATSGHEVERTSHSNWALSPTIFRRALREIG